MTRVGLSISSLMAAMTVVAIDVSAMRTVASRPVEMTGMLSFLAFGSLPMASLLVALAFLGVRRSRFRRGFLVAGWLGVIAGIACRIFASEIIAIYVESILDAFDDATGLGTSYTWTGIGEICVIPLLLLLPQLCIAVAGGWARNRKGRNESGRLTGAVVSGARRSVQTKRVACAIAVLLAPVLVLEGILRRTIDPQLSRFSTGTVARLDLPDSTGYFIPFPDGVVFTPNGTAVRIEEDRQPSVIGKAMGNGTGPYGDLRRVRVTVLAGSALGRSAEFFRCNLKPGAR